MDLEMYKENVLDHYKNPRNKRAMNDCSIKHRGVNPLCGDEVTIFLKIDETDLVKDVSFQGEGCVISQASASLLTEYLVGKSIKDINKLTTETILNLLGIPISHTRMKCALLALKTLKEEVEKLKTTNNQDNIMEKKK